MRGQAKKVQCVETGTRITPADAGTSVRAIRVRMYVRDHPRGCGDKMVVLSASDGVMGSPPRMRGQVKETGAPQGYLRITPADAGTSGDFGWVPRANGDHPRGCGDKQTHEFMKNFCRGSPPRMRGQADPAGEDCPSGRITPADAGTSANWFSASSAWTDHPRGCGDKPGRQNAQTIARGSPPRMRGQVVHRDSGNLSVRITPADAGTSSLSRAGSCIYPDHPRGCGDKQNLGEFCLSCRGSPPRMRGQAYPGGGAVFSLRITPADAGTR